MAQLILDPQYQGFANDLVDVFQKNNVVLSEPAARLIALSAEGWLSDIPPPTRPGVLLNKALREQIARNIVEATIREPHVQQQLANNRPVPYALLLWSLAISGRAVLSTVLAKGFRW
jgi:hypothetical protein